MKKQKGLSKKTLGGLIAGFGALLVGGVAYAATTGTLQFNGDVSRSGTVDLNIVDEVCVGTTDPSVCEVSVNAAKHIMTFTINLNAPGASQQIDFCVENVGNLSATLGTLSVVGNPTNGSTSATANIRGIEFSGLDSLTGQVILPGEKYCTANIVATWNAAELVDTSSVPFQASIDWMKTP